MTCLLQQYRLGRTRGEWPALLLSRGADVPHGAQDILAFDVAEEIEVRNGVLYRNGVAAGNAIDTFDALLLPKSDNLFPMWVGFFAYEFARYFDLPVPPGDSVFPDAHFRLYRNGVTREKSANDSAGRAVTPPTLTSIGNLDGAISDVLERIRRGDVYQVNLSQRFNVENAATDIAQLFAQLVHNNPSPFMSLYEHPDWSIISASPERLIRIGNGEIASRPIAGTRRRGSTSEEDNALTQELLNSSKERAEHAMLVDLVRNDLNQICDTNTVAVTEAFTVEYFAHVMHLVSEVRGALRSDVGLQDIFRATFPAGTITGTPKESAMQAIADLEPQARGPYTGSFGYVASSGVLDFNILIRTMMRAHDKVVVQAGAGVVMQSEHALEQSEIMQKAKGAVLRAWDNPSMSFRRMPESRQMQKRDSFPATILQGHSNHKVLFLECHDSFSHNLVALLRSLGCEVDVVDHRESPLLEHFTHLVLGPGPGTPEQSGRLMEWIAAAEQAHMPTLGICLGHQAIGLHFGAQLRRAPRAIHGEVHEVFHHNHGLFSQLPSPLQMMRYHSLALHNLPENIVADAWCNDDTIMAICHARLPFFGLQFHPESFLSKHGADLLARFLEVNP